MLSHKKTGPGPTEIPEVVLNLWYFVEESHGAVYRLAGRAYALTGSDEQKLAVLHKLSATDFHIAQVFPVPKRFKTVSDFGTLEGVTGAEVTVEDPTGLFKEAIDALEASLPIQMRSIDENPQTYRLKIPQNPLMVCTCVIEHEDGTLEPRLAK
jgi:hypothetical protein